MGRFLTLFAVLMLVAPAPRAEKLFGQLAIGANRIDAIPKWVKVLERIQAENLVWQCRQENDACRKQRAEWYEMLGKAAQESRKEQMERVNSWANNYPYINDIDLWGRSDYWETPGEFADRSGDCEDYSIMKYYSLKALGWPEQSLRMVVVHDAVRDMPHAVLDVELDGENFILDNLASEPLPDRYVRQYTPYYAVNAKRRWIFVKPMEE